MDYNKAFLSNFAYLLQTISSLIIPLLCAQVTGSKVVAALPVFALSSVLHEFHLAAALGFYAPIFLLLFGLIGSELA